MQYRVTGNGPPVVFLHGAGGSARLWGNQFQAFRDLSRCYFLDLPGHGASPPIPNITIESYAAAVSDFLAELDEPAILVGHSMGGAIALEVALTTRTNLRGLVLAGAGCRLPVSQKLLSGLNSDYESTADSIIRYCFSKNADPELLVRARAEMRNTSPEIVRADFNACTAFDRCADAGNVRIPTLIVCGEKDIMTPPAFSQQLHSVIPDSRLEVVPRGSHMLMLEFPNEFNDILSGEVVGKA